MRPLKRNLLNKDVLALKRVKNIAAVLCATLKTKAGLDHVLLKAADVAEALKDSQAVDLWCVLAVASLITPQTSITWTQWWAINSGMTKDRSIKERQSTKDEIIVVVVTMTPIMTSQRTSTIVSIHLSIWTWLMMDQQMERATRRCPMLRRSCSALSVNDQGQRDDRSIPDTTKLDTTINNEVRET